MSSKKYMSLRYLIKQRNYWRMRQRNASRLYRKYQYKQKAIAYDDEIGRRHA